VDAGSHRRNVESERSRLLLAPARGKEIDRSQEVFPSISSLTLAQQDGAQAKVGFGAKPRVVKLGGDAGSIGESDRFVVPRSGEIERAAAIEVQSGCKRSAKQCFKAHPSTRRERMMSDSGGSASIP